MSRGFEQDGDEFVPFDDSLTPLEKAGNFQGINVYANPEMTPGTVEFRDSAGKTLGWIFNIAEIHIGQRVR